MSTPPNFLINLNMHTRENADRFAFIYAGVNLELEGFTDDQKFQLALELFKDVKLTYSAEDEKQ